MATSRKTLRHLMQRCLGSGLLCRFFAAAISATQQFSVNRYRYSKTTIMIRTFLINNHVGWGCLFTCCQQFLQSTFGIGNKSLTLLQFRQKRQVEWRHRPLHRY